MTDLDRTAASLESVVLEAADAEVVVGVESVQTLWSGYGHIMRYRLDGGLRQSVIVKHVSWPEQRHHPRSWNTSRSHQRKLKSYQVETVWYDRYAQNCSDDCRVPGCLAIETKQDEVVMVLEDLDAAGFVGRRQQVSNVEVEACLSWLAHFHATFMGETPDLLWATGTYWHLATRPDEFDALADGPIKSAAGLIDRKLTESQFQTFVHGDAKLANFCFDADGGYAAAVDFQYVGGGCGMKDLAYFVSSCFDENESEVKAPKVIDRYFELLGGALADVGKNLDFTVLEKEWRALYPVAWTDFYRFLQGWSPGHWKLHRYSERLALEVLDSLASETS